MTNTAALFIIGFTICGAMIAVLALIDIWLLEKKFKNEIENNA